jgi:NDP-sugar pyrophosphorylase family protein
MSTKSSKDRVPKRIPKSKQHKNPDGTFATVPYSTNIANSAFISPNAIIGKKVRIKGGAIIIDTTIGDNSTIGIGARIYNSIIGKGAEIGKYSILRGNNVHDSAKVDDYTSFGNGDRIGLISNLT